MFQSEQINKLKANIFADIERRREIWKALSELWVLYGAKETLHQRFCIPEDIKETDIDKHIAKEIEKLIRPLNYTSQEIEGIYLYEVQPALFCLYLPFGLGFTNVAAIDLPNIHIDVVEKRVLRTLRWPGRFSIARLIHRIFGNFNPVKARWAYLQKIITKNE